MRDAYPNLLSIIRTNSKAWIEYWVIYAETQLKNNFHDVEIKDTHANNVNIYNDHN